MNIYLISCEFWFVRLSILSVLSKKLDACSWHTWVSPFAWPRHPPLDGNGRHHPLMLVDTVLASPRTLIILKMNVIKPKLFHPKLALLWPPYSVLCTLCLLRVFYSTKKYRSRSCTLGGDGVSGYTEAEMTKRHG